MTHRWINTVLDLASLAAAVAALTYQLNSG
jgi:hypothetical protein